MFTFPVVKGQFFVKSYADHPSAQHLGTFGWHVDDVTEAPPGRAAKIRRSAALVQQKWGVQWISTDFNGLQWISKDFNGFQ